MKEEKKTPPAEETPSEEIDAIAKANEASERLEAANKEARTLALKLQTAKAEQQLGGSTEAGTTKPKEETPEEYAQRVIKGE